VPLRGAGTKTTGVGATNPGRLDLAARHGRRLESVPDEVMDEVLARISVIFE